MRRPLALFAIALVFLLTACDQRYRAADMERIARSAATSRATASASIVTWVNKDKATWSEFLEMANNQLDAALAASAANSANPAAGATALIDASLFATAVLDAGQVLELQPDAEDRLGGTNPEQEIAWWSVGRLAFNAASNLQLAGRTKDARAAVLAGPKRWQTDSYWNRFADHDALAAVIMAQNNETAEALKRLRSRPFLEPPADEVLRTLEGK